MILKSLLYIIILTNQKDCQFYCVCVWLKSGAMKVYFLPLVKEVFMKIINFSVKETWELGGKEVSESSNVEPELETQKSIR